MNFQRAIRSVWSLRLGVVLAFLPIPAFAVVLFLSFAGICLLPSILLLWSHIRSSRAACCAFGFALVEILVLVSYVVYVNLAS